MPERIRSETANSTPPIPITSRCMFAFTPLNTAVKMAKAYAPFVRKIEVEVETLEQLGEALEAGADIVMLDNMDYATMEKAVAMSTGKAETECSGNVTAENIARLTNLGVNYISSGALTHSAPILDLSLKNLHPIEE